MTKTPSEFGFSVPDSQPSTLNSHHLLADIRTIFEKTAADRMFTRDLISELKALPGATWRERLEMVTVPERWLAGALRRHNLRPRVLWITGTTARGYLATDFNANTTSRVVPTARDQL